MSQAVPTPERNSRDAPLQAARVLFVAADLSTGGGVNKVIRDQAVLFSHKLGLDVAVANARGNRPSTYDFPPEVAVKSFGRRSLFSYVRLLLRLRRSAPDFVIGSWTQDNILIALAFLFSPSRLILVEHTSWHFHRAFVRLLRRWIYPLAWRVIVLNPAELAHYRNFLRNVRLLPNFIAPAAAVAEQPSEKLILAVGHLEARKNFADAIRAMALSRLEEQGWSLAIVGEGPQDDALRRLIAELGLTRTTIHPPTGNLAAWYARASITVVTARLEVFSLVLAEAMLAGVVPIAYSTDGPAFILEDFQDHLVAIGDVDALAERLVRFAGEPDLDQLRSQLRCAIETRFSPEVIGAQWRELLAPAPCQ